MKKKLICTVLSAFSLSTVPVLRSYAAMEEEPHIIRQQLWKPSEADL